MFRVARVRSEETANDFQRHLSLHYMNAKLQRAKTIPSLASLSGQKKPPTMKSIVEALKAAPTFKQE